MVLTLVTNYGNPCRWHATGVTRILDPDACLFGNRILSRGDAPRDDSDTYMKGLFQVYTPKLRQPGCHHMVPPLHPAAGEPLFKQNLEQRYRYTADSSLDVRALALPEDILNMERGIAVLRPLFANMHCLTQGYPGICDLISRVCLCNAEGVNFGAHMSQRFYSNLWENLVGGMPKVLPESWIQVLACWVTGY